VSALCVGVAIAIAVIGGVVAIGELTTRRSS
jgi:hypothetical protein